MSLLSARFFGLGLAVMCTCAAMRARVEAIVGECWRKLEKTSEIGVSWRISAIYRLHMVFCYLQFFYTLR